MLLHIVHGQICHISQQGLMDIAQLQRDHHILLWYHHNCAQESCISVQFLDRPPCSTNSTLNRQQLPLSFCTLVAQKHYGMLLLFLSLSQHH